MVGLKVKNLNSVPDGHHQGDYEFDDPVIERYRIHLSGRTRNALCLPVAFGMGLDGLPVRNRHPSLFLRPEYCRNEALLEYAEDYFKTCYRFLIRTDADLLKKLHKSGLFTSFLNYALYSGRDGWIEDLAAIFYELKLQSDQLFLLTALLSRLNGEGVAETLYASLLQAGSPSERYYRSFVTGRIPLHNDLSDFDRATLYLLSGRIHKGASLLVRMSGPLAAAATRELLDLYTANGKQWLFLHRLRRGGLPYEPELFYDTLYSVYRLGQKRHLERLIESVLSNREPPGDFRELRDAMESSGGSPSIPQKFVWYVQTYRLLSDEDAPAPAPDQVERDPDRWAAAYFAKCLRDRNFPTSIPSLFRAISGRNYYARMVMGLYYDSRGDFKTAALYLLRSPSAHPYVHQVRAKLNFMTGNQNAAHSDLLHLLKRFPDDAHLWHNLSVLLKHEGREREAEMAEARAHTIDPEFDEKS